VKPVLLTIAGPNGAGKTTITSRLRVEKWSENVEYLNPDDIARDRFGDWNSPEAVLSAARWTEARREELLAARQGIAFETVFSTESKIDFLLRARAAGYFIRVFFIGTSDPGINAARVVNRVLAGGHSVPIDKLVSRYVKSLANLGPAIQVADRVYVYDNSVDNTEARLCARTHGGTLRKVYGELPQWVADAVDGLDRHSEFVDLRSAS
jgi:predicted ABC-type ATPase